MRCFAKKICNVNFNLEFLRIITIKHYFIQYMVSRMYLNLISKAIITQSREISNENDLHHQFRVFSRPSTSMAITTPHHLLDKREINHPINRFYPGFSQAFCNCTYGISYTVFNSDREEKPSKG
jgi:hypothetical protein